MEQTIIRLAIGLVLLVAVNVVLGSLNALFDGTFDRIKCRNGVIKGIIIAACFVAFYVAGRLNPDIVAIDIDGETVNVATAANLAMVTAYVLYAKDVFFQAVQAGFEQNERDAGADRRNHAARIGGTGGRGGGHRSRIKKEPRRRHGVGVLLRVTCWQAWPA